MELGRHIDTLRAQLTAVAEVGGEEARALAQQLAASLESAVRLMLLDALAVAAAEITRELAPGSVDVRLRGGEPEFVVLAPWTADSADDVQAIAEARGGTSALPESAGTGDGAVSRFNLRLPDQLKVRVEQAADREGISINTWLVRAAAAAAERGEAGARPDPIAPKGGQGYTGWGR